MLSRARTRASAGEEFSMPIFNSYLPHSNSTSCFVSFGAFRMGVVVPHFPDGECMVTLFVSSVSVSVIERVLIPPPAKALRPYRTSARR